MGIACRGSVKAGCAAFVNPRTGFLMPVRFSVYGPRGLSCPLPSALAAALQGNARGCGARCGLRGGAAGARSAHKGGGLGPRLWFGWPGGQRPPGRQTPPPPPGPRRSSPPPCQAYTLGKGRYPLLILLPSACPAPSRPPLRWRCWTDARGCGYPLRRQGGAAGARSRTKAGAWPPPQLVEKPLANGRSRPF